MLRMRKRQEPAPLETAPGLPAPPPGAAPPRPVRVIAGADVQDLDLVGRTVADARAVAQAIFGVAPDALALLDGHHVDEHTVLGEGQLLEFVKHAGEKGAEGAPTAEAPAASGTIELVEDRAVWRRNGQAVGTLRLGTLVGRIAAAGAGPPAW